MEVFPAALLKETDVAKRWRSSRDRQAAVFKANENIKPICNVSAVSSTLVVGLYTYFGSSGSLLRNKVWPKLRRLRNLGSDM